MKQFWFMAALAALITGGGCARALDATATTGAPPSTQYVIFVDCSASIGPEQAARWATAAKQLVCDRLQPGAGILVLPISDLTANSADVYDMTIPTLPRGAGMEPTLKVRRTLAESRKDSLEAVRGLLHSTHRSRSTELLASIPRIPRTNGRRTVVLYVSDGQEASRIIDLEKTPITDRNLTRLAQRAVDHYGFRAGQLDGVQVRFVLESPLPGHKPPVNDHRALERFWRLVFEGLGAQLVSFDTRITN